MKLIVSAVIVISALSGTFSLTPDKAKKLAPPKIVYKNAKARHKQLRAEALNKIINPLLCESEVTVSDITMDFCPEILGPEEGRGCKNEAKGELTISVTVNWADGSSGVAWIERNKEGGLGLTIMSAFVRTLWAKPFADNETVPLGLPGARNILRRSDFAAQSVDTTSCVRRDFEMGAA